MKYGCDLLNEAVDFCKQKKWIAKNDTVLLALSGGADSVFLFYVFLALKQYIPFNLHAIHINHLLRESESDADESFVEKLTENNNVHSALYKINVAKIAEDCAKSIEMAAREARYDLIFKEADKIKASVIATAHNADDKVETALMRFISGSSVTGISGLREIRQYKNKKIIRPIINFFKSDILEYLKKNNIPFRFDSSNNNDIYLRNKIRNRLIPFIEKDFNPNFKKNLLSTIGLFENQADYLKTVSRECLNEVSIRKNNFFVFNKTGLMEFHPCIINQVLVDSLYAVGGADIRVASCHLKNVVAQIKSTSNRTYVFPENIIAVADRRYLIIMDNNLYREFIEKQDFLHEIKPDTEFSCRLPCGLSADVSVSGILEEYGQDSTINDNVWDSFISGKDIFFSLSVPFEQGLAMRFRKEGDKIHFKYGRKKLKKYFIDTHIPFLLRNILPVIANRDEIVWAPQIRAKDLAGIKTSKNALTIKIKMRLN